MKNNKGWSFCIVTVPGNEQLLSEAISKIVSELVGSPYEILVIGNPVLDIEKFNNCRFIPFKESFFKPSISRRSISLTIKKKSLKPIFFRDGAICHKKNLAAKHAQYDKLCIMHDYVGLEPGWLKGFERFGDDWQVAMNIILNKNGARDRDWMAWDHPLIMTSSKSCGACLIPYNKYTKYMYISGGYFCVKKEFFLDNQLNEKLFWGQGEDIEWSLRVRELTRFQMNIGSVVKYLKLKDVNGAPNCESWRESELKMLKIFGDDDVA